MAKIFWKHHIEAWQASGLSQAAYCRQQGLNPHTFSTRLRGERTVPQTAGSSLIPVHVEPGVSPAGALVLRISGGRYLEVPPTVSPRWLAELLQCLV